MTQWLQDARYAVRSIARRPLYAVVTVLVLAIAIGANTTVFSVLNGLFLRPLPYPDGDRLVVVYDSYRKMNIENVGTAIPDYLDRREQAHSLASLAIVTGQPRTLGGGTEPGRVQTMRVSPSLFTVLRVAPELGRAFADDEATIGNDRVVVLSDRLWRTGFGANASVLGTDIRLDGEAYRVIGVMPRGFGFPNRGVDAWTPFAFTPAQMSDAARGNEFSMSIGRLRDGATIEALNAELDAIVKRNVASGRLPRDAVDVAGFTGRAEPLRDLAVGGLAPMVLMLQATVLAVLLIACANVANLQLAHVLGRRREFALRAALGAQRNRLARLVLVESLVLALAGAAIGLALATGGLKLVTALGLDRTSQGFEFRLDETVLAFTLGTAALAALVSGLPPVIALLRDDVARSVRESARQSAGRGMHALRSALVVAQIGLSIALLAGAGLLIKGFYGLQKEGPGFDASHVWTAGMALPTSRYATPASWAEFERHTLAALRALPGVADAGFTSVLPFVGNNDQGSYVIDGYTPPPGAPPPHAQQRSINEGFLPALGIPVIAGRNFTASEPERVAIVDTNVAKKYWTDGKAVGQRIRHNLDPPDRWYTVIGVVPAVKQADLAESPVKETIYWYYAQRPMAVGRLALRTTLPPARLTAAARRAIAALDPELALFEVQPLAAFVDRSLGPERTPMVLTLVFAAVAFTLAVIGIYGVLTWAVTQRFAEIGVRLALGARSRDIVRMVLAEGGKLIAIGLVVGLSGAAVLGRALAARIPGVAAFDPVVLAIAAIGLAAAAFVATWLPAHRAGRTDPMRVLREE